jgi:hypothetical protein
MEQRVKVKTATGTRRAQKRRVSKRKEPQVPARQIVRYHVLELVNDELQLQRIGTTLASDISLDGVFLAHVTLKIGTRLHFYFELPDGYVECVGKVVHNQHRVDSFGVAKPGSGVRFVIVSGMDRMRLAKYLAGKGRGHRIPEQPGLVSAVE